MAWRLHRLSARIQLEERMNARYDGVGSGGSLPSLSSDPPVHGVDPGRSEPYPKDTARYDGEMG